MPSIFQRIFSRPQSSFSADEHLALQTRIRELEMEVQSLEQTIDRLHADNQRIQADGQDRAAAELNAHLEEFMQQAASPVSQLLTQAWLVDAQNKPLQAADVLTVSRRLVRVLENAGMQILHAAGESASYNANHHAPMNASVAMRDGQAVRIRFPGIAWQGRILLKAAVEAADAENA